MNPSIRTALAIGIPGGKLPTGSCGSRPAMGQQLVELLDRLLTDPREHILQSRCFRHFYGARRTDRLHQLARPHETPQNRHCLAAAIAAHEYPVVPAHRDASQGPLRMIVVESTDRRPPHSASRPPSCSAYRRFALCQPRSWVLHRRESSPVLLRLFQQRRGGLPATPLSAGMRSLSPPASSRWITG
jgi:hypothetical protein